MSKRSTVVFAVLALSLVGFGLVFSPASGSTQEPRPRGAGSFFLTEPAEALAWDARIDALQAAGDLVLMSRDAERMAPGWQHERFQQYYRGLRVFGAQVMRHSRDGRTESVNGLFHEGIELDTTPGITPGQARLAAETLLGGRAMTEPELLIYRFAGAFRLAYRLHLRVEWDLILAFLDAADGSVIESWSDLRTQSPVGFPAGAVIGRATGTHGDTKKFSSVEEGGTFRARDLIRPAQTRTVDVNGNFQAWNNLQLPAFANSARDNDNVWDDGAVVDAHVYSGWTYDYLFRRFGRDGINNGNAPIDSFVHFWLRSFGPGPLLNNAFYFPFDNSVHYGDGDGFTFTFFASGLDVVAHELTHGVSNFTNGLINRDEPGTLGEHFSDVIGASVEFFFEEVGFGRQRADWFLGEDIFIVNNFDGTRVIRSLINPRAVGDPDNFNARFTGPEDNGGVHINAGIGNNAYFLFVEGGINSTSGIRVTGIGFENRERAERIWFRACTQFLGPLSGYRELRRGTLQSARDLFGAGSREEQQLTQAWNAVGVP